MLYHWTERDRAECILREGFRDCGSNSFETGVHTYDHPTAGRKWGDVCVYGDIPAHALDASWARPYDETLGARKWVLPYEVATERLTKVSDSPSTDNTEPT
jgi:hypothetical protein